MKRCSHTRAAKALAVLLAFAMAAVTLAAATSPKTASAAAAGGGQGAAAGAAAAGATGAVGAAQQMAAVAFLAGTGLGDQAAQIAGILAEAAGRGVPLLREVVDPFAADVQAKVRTATAQAASVAKMVKSVAGPSVKALFEQFKNNPVISAMPDGRYQFSLAQGRLTVSKHGSRLAVYIVVDGPNQSSGVIGISDTNPLREVHSQRMANDGNQPTAFADVAPDARSFIQARMPLGGQGLPQLTAREFIDVGGQVLELSLGALDPDDTTVKGGLSVGLEATADAEVSVEAGATAGVFVEISPLKAGPVIAGAAQAMARAASQAGGRAPGPAPGGRMSPDAAATVLKAGLDYVLNKADPRDLGEVGFEVEASCSIGAGVLDTTAAVGSASGGISVTMPATRGLTIAHSTIRDFLEGGRRLAPVFRRLGSAVVLGRADAQFMNSVLSQLETAAQGAARTAADAFVQAASSSTVGLGFSVDLGAKTTGEKSSGSSGGKGAGQGGTQGDSSGGKDEAETTCTLFEISADIPLSTGVNEVLSGDSMQQTVVALASIARCMLPPPLGWNSAAGSGGQNVDWNALAQAVAADATLGITLSPGIPLVTVNAEMPARDLLVAMQVQNEASTALLGGLVSAVRQRSLSPLSARETHGALRQLSSDSRLLGLRKNSTFGISFGGGAAAEVGAEVVVGGGLGFSAYTRANPEILLAYTIGSDLPDVTGEASIGFEVVEDAQGGLSLGEGVEFSVTGGLKTNMDFLCVRFKEWDQPFAPSTVNVAGFTVTDFEGSMNNDGSFSGSGRLLLPSGGSVYATFSVDAQGHVVNGSWSGSLTAAGRQFNVSSGTVSDSGLHWTSQVFFPFTSAAGSAGVSASVNCTLRPWGQLAASGQVDINILGSMKTFTIGLDEHGRIIARYNGGITIGPGEVGVGLTISSEGLSGTATLNLLGRTIALDLHSNNAGALYGSGKTTLTIFGQNTEVNVVLAPDGSVVATAALTLNIGGQQRTFVLQLDGAGSLSGTCGGAVTVGGRTISSLAVTASGTTATLTGKTAFLGAQQTFDLTVSQGQVTGGSGKASISLFGQTGELNLVLSSSGEITGTGAINLNIAGTSRRFDLTVDNQGNITGTCSSGVTIGGRQIASLTLSRINNQTNLKGRIALAGSTAEFALDLDDSGNLSGSYTGSVQFAGREMTGTFTLNPDGSITCNAGVKVKVAGVDRTFALTVDSQGNISGRFQGSLSVGGRSISSVVLNMGGGMGDGGISGTGSIRLAGEQRTFDLSVDASGNVTGSYRGGISVGGFAISNEFRLGFDGSITCSGLANLRVAGTTLPFTVSVDSSGNVTAALSTSHSGLLSIGGKQFSSLSLTLNNSGMKGSAAFRVLGSPTAFTLTVDGPSGKVTGTAHATLTARLPGNKEVKILSSTLSLDEGGTITGLGTVKAANASVASASFEVDGGGNISGSGTVKVKTLGVSCGFSLSESSFSVWARPPQGFSYGATMTVDVANWSFTFGARLSLGVKETNKVVATATGTVSVKEKTTNTNVGSCSASGDVNLANGNVTVRVRIPQDTSKPAVVDKNVTFAMPWDLVQQ